METIGKKILELRKRKGLTQEELSDLAKINLRTLQRIEKGETEPLGNTMKRLCEILEINLEDILDYGKKDDKHFLIFFHLSVLSFLIIPLGNIIIPAILWLTKREKVIDLNERGADLLNFQILWTILVFISFIMSILVYFGGHSDSGTVYMPAILIALILIIINLIYTVVVSIWISKKSSKRYFYPLIKFIKL
jgi:uncharacterized Tic20 family protein